MSPRVKLRLEFEQLRADYRKLAASRGIPPRARFNRMLKIAARMEEIQAHLDDPQHSITSQFSFLDRI